MEVNAVRLCRCLSTAVIVLALVGHATAGDITGFVGLAGNSVTKNVGFPDQFGGEIVESAFFLEGFTPSVLVFDVAAVSESSLEDQLFFLSFVNNTGANLQRIDVRLGVLPSGGSVATFSEGFGSVFGDIDPVLQPSLFFPVQNTDPANPVTHGGVSVPSWSDGLPGKLHFSASVLNTDHDMALWVDVTPVPEPATGLVLLGGASLALRRSRRIE